MSNQGVSLRATAFLWSVNNVPNVLNFSDKPFQICGIVPELFSFIGICSNYNVFAIVYLIMSRGCSYYNAFIQAVCDGREDLLDDLLKRCTEDQINSLDKQGYAALHYAVKSGSVSMIKKLLEAQCGEFAHCM